MFSSRFFQRFISQLKSPTSPLAFVFVILYKKKHNCEMHARVVKKKKNLISYLKRLYTKGENNIF